MDEINWRHIASQQRARVYWAAFFSAFMVLYLLASHLGRHLREEHVLTGDYAWYINWADAIHFWILPFALVGGSFLVASLSSRILFAGLPRTGYSET